MDLKMDIQIQFPVYRKFTGKDDAPKKGNLRQFVKILSELEVLIITSMKKPSGSVNLISANYKLKEKSTDRLHQFTEIILCKKGFETCTEEEFNQEFERYEAINN